VFFDTLYAAEGALDALVEVLADDRLDVVLDSDEAEDLTGADPCTGADMLAVDEDAADVGAGPRAGGVEDINLDVAWELDGAGARSGAAEDVVAPVFDVELAALDGSEVEFGFGCRPARRWCSRAIA
jgi:hypothetical protein